MDPRSPANRGWDPHPHPRRNRGWGWGWGSGVPCPGSECCASAGQYDYSAESRWRADCSGGWVRGVPGNLKRCPAVRVAESVEMQRFGRRRSIGRGEGASKPEKHVHSGPVKPEGPGDAKRAGKLGDRPFHLERVGPPAQPTLAAATAHAHAHAHVLAASRRRGALSRGPDSSLRYHPRSSATDTSVHTSIRRLWPSAIFLRICAGTAPACAVA